MHPHTILAVLAALASPAAFAQTLDYEIDCPEGATSAGACTVGEQTYEGWRTYSSVCLHCHGQGEMGSTFAPSLLRVMDAYVDWPRFRKAVLEGVRGQRGVMQGFADDPQVAEHVEDMCRYLKAQADGALPNSRPGTAGQAQP